MTCQRTPPRAGNGGDRTCRSGTRHGFLRGWLLTNSILGGVFALLWLILRSGPKPSRFAYPCQQAALSAATLAFGVPVVSAVVNGRRRLATALRTPGGMAVAAVGLVCTAGAWVHFSCVTGYDGPVLTPREEYRAQVFHVAHCPEAPIGDRFVGLDNLIALMGRQDLKFYRSAAHSLASGPDGIIAPDDVVVIKINYQWGERGGTNMDLLRGLIRRIVDHPGTFVGEIVVCENAQFLSTDGFDRSYNNAEDPALSPLDIVAQFSKAGYTISTYDWTAMRETSVGEYSDGNMTDGYVLYAHDEQLAGRVSYPKFQTAFGTYISLRDGIWSPSRNTYDRAHLKFVNLPVLKSHSFAYGVTACVKNYMGVVTGAQSTNAHWAVANGLLGAVLGEIGPADLNILDCIWINADPNDGPPTDYAVATRRDELVASVDPVAADIWAVRNILIPAFLANGFSPPWPSPSADPDEPGGAFRTYLKRSMSYVLAAGYDVTNDPDRIDAYTWDGTGDSDGDSDVDLADCGALLACFSGAGAAVPAGCDGFDIDGDNDVDLDDFLAFPAVLTGPGSS